MNHLTVEKLNAKNRNAALSLINSAYDNVHGFEPLTAADLRRTGTIGFLRARFYGWQVSQFRIQLYGRGGVGRNPLGGCA